MHGVYKIMEKELGRFAKFVKDIQDYVLIDNETMRYFCGECDFVSNINIDMKKWKLQDLRNLATNKYGYVTFDTLLLIADRAEKTVANAGKVYTDDAVLAQNALTVLKPDGIEWKAFADGIHTVAGETAPKRAELKAALPETLKEVQKKLEGISPEQRKLNEDRIKQVQDSLRMKYGIAPVEINKQPADTSGVHHLLQKVESQKKDSTNGQKVGAVLKKSGATLDNDHSLKGPLNTAVTEAVKGIKSQIAYAA